MLGGHVRSTDFIYRSAGVNRPLRDGEDHPGDNLNKTYYRDQINKVANAIKGIVSALKKPPLNPAEKDRNVNPDCTSSGGLKLRFIVGTLILAVLALLGYFNFSNIPKAGKKDKTIAVLPFRNLSQETISQKLSRSREIL